MALRTGGPEHEPIDAGLVEVGTLIRREVEQVVVAYSFDLRTNQLETTLLPNPSAGQEHIFKAYRLEGDPPDYVSLRSRAKILAELTTAEMQITDDES